MNFADRLIDAIDKKKSYIVVGLDPDHRKIPKYFYDRKQDFYINKFDEISDIIYQFNRTIIDIVAPIVPAVKPQIAFYERYGVFGVRAFLETVQYAKSKGLIVIGDVKRNDIGNTAHAYADSYLGRVEIDGSNESVFDLDAITVNPYLGSDGIIPFIDNVKEYNKGIFVLVKSSNPSSREIQDCFVCTEESDDLMLYEHIAQRVNFLGKDCVGNNGYSSVGAVVGGTHPVCAKSLRKIMPKSFFLVPGYGAQGATGKDLMNFFNKDGYGALISASRSINYPHGGYLDVDSNNFESMVAFAVMDMNRDINNNIITKKALLLK